MEQDLLPTELILNHSQQSLGNVYLDWMPQPGAHIDFDGQTYAVMERRHRYCLKANRYHLSKIHLYVQSTKSPEETSLVGDRWVIGDISCRYNAASELLRCAVNPDGPCQGCGDYEAASPNRSPT
ncbi:DUF6464 family protein [Almyronema epifaneia]|uniref:DUF6464 family protein n=1 Tax=Almyronema epifaneia S1 TaxID=2991925 RepID=A0ABW6IGE0_9CYAN